MKLTTILLLVAVLQVSARSNAQTITYEAQSVSLENLFSVIKQQTGFVFFYRQDDLAKTSVVSVSFKNTPLQQALDEILKGQQLSYNIQGKAIFITLSPPNTVDKEEEKLNSPPPPIDVHGRIVNEKGEPVVGASVRLKGTNIGVSTDDNGEFKLVGIDANATLQISGTNIEMIEWKVNGKSELTITAKIKIAEGEEITVQVNNNGYQYISKEKATGSFVRINNELINRCVGTDILDRLENVTSGLLFNRGDNQPVLEPLQIRGRSTIFSNSQPLIVLDNFPYEGNISNLNPNDIESITILRDAAAASIWGARAGNGVIVINTKKGKNGKAKIQFNSNITITQKPDLFSTNRIKSSDYIDLEKTLFTNGYYDDVLANTYSYPPLTPVVEILAKQRDGLISQQEADETINSLRNNDVRNDLKKYFYQTRVNQQYAINVSGNTPDINYYMSAGYDRGNSELVGNQSQRFTLRSQNTFKISSRLQAYSSLNIIVNENNVGNNSGYSSPGLGNGKNYYPYADLVSNEGQPLDIVCDYRKGYADTAGGGKLNNWTYNPYKNIGTSTSKLKTNDYLVNVGLNYRFTNFMSIDIKYQYQNSIIVTENVNTAESYYTRDLVNKYTQVLSDGSIILPVPNGGIKDLANSELNSHNGRGQFNLDKSWRKNSVTMIAGFEIRNISTKGNSSRVYGYDENGNLAISNIDYSMLFSMYGRPFDAARIPNPLSVLGTTTRFLSYYTTASYTYNDRYTLSASARKDGSNLFGVKTNQKSVPLWSTGISWQLNKENFFSNSDFDLLKLRVTYGVQGNLTRDVAASVTATMSTSNYTNLLIESIRNPPNEKLKWETVGMINIGADFSIWRGRFSGTVEYFKKNAHDLIGSAPLDPTLGGSNQGGVSSFQGNVAAMKGQGVDIQLSTQVLNGKIKWSNDFLFSYVFSKVTKYLAAVSDLGVSYLNYNIINPTLGKPIYAIYSYAWGGLDPVNGNPLGVVDGNSSDDYESIVYNTKVTDMRYKGTLQPTYFGAFRNTITWNNLSFSFNISYKLGYYFVRPSLDYGTLFSSWSGSNDYAKRWQKTGDEKITNIPSMVYPVNYSRDLFYTFSETLVERADHVRLEDITLSYSIDKKQWSKLPFQNIRLYSNISNIGTLWGANKQGIDPYFTYSPKIGKSIAFGITAQF